MKNTILVSKNLVSPKTEIVSKADFIEEYKYPEDSNLRELRYNTAPIYLLELGNVAIAGRGYVLEKKTWSPIFKHEGLRFFPAYVELFFNEGACDSSIYIILKKKLKPIKVKSVVSIIHFNFIYGHFLLEMLPKLFILKDAFKHSDHIPALTLPTDLPLWLKNYIMEVWGDWKIIWFNPNEEYIAAEQTFVVTDDFSQFFFSTLAQNYLSFAGQNNSESPQKIMIARPDNHYSLRNLTNFNTLKTIAIDHGYQIIEPGSLGSLQKQANLFNGSRIILGEYTSALHNALFSPHGTYIGCLNYWPLRIQDCIAAVHGHNLNYLLSDEGPVVVDYTPSKPKEIRDFVISETKFIRMINDIENHIKQKVLNTAA